jgi:hypothetical protein
MTAKKKEKKKKQGTPSEAMWRTKYAVNTLTATVRFAPDTTRVGLPLAYTQRALHHRHTYTQ